LSYIVFSYATVNWGSRVGYLSNDVGVLEITVQQVNITLLASISGFNLPSNFTMATSSLLSIINALYFFFFDRISLNLTQTVLAQGVMTYLKKKKKKLSKMTHRVIAIARHTARAET
jgi:hypothetical protein